MLYRLIKETGEIDEIDKPKFWTYLKYYYDLTPKFKKDTNELLYIGGVIETPLYVFCQSKDRLKKEL
jgi:hypothetical protein